MKDNDKTIFKYFEKNNNDMLSNLTEDDLDNFFRYLKLYYLELRKVINLEQDDTFGLEIEYENSNNNIIEDNIKYNWFVKHDSSLFNGGEATSTTLFDSEKNWQDLNDVCTLISENSKFGVSAGGHIHIGAQALGSKYESWVSFIKLWSVYENVLFRYAYNDYLTERPRQLKYAAPIANELWLSSKCTSKDKCVSKEDHFKYYRLLDDLPQLRDQAVNFLNVKDVYQTLDRNTLEFRCPNGTLNPIIWQNNVNVFSKLLNSCKHDKIDLEYIMYRQEKIKNIKNSLIAYRKIYIKQALELSDMIFDNNLDKIYFLRQYFKDFEVGNEPLILAKKFTM